MCSHGNSFYSVIHIVLENKGMWEMVALSVDLVLQLSHLRQSPGVERGLHCCQT